MDMYSSLRTIIEKSDKKPVIVNPSSNFVVVTYWWGRGNKNNNTARPCVAFYESVINPIIEMALEALRSASKSEVEIKKTMKILDVILPKLGKYKNHVLRKAQAYMDMVASYCNIELNSSDRDAKTLICLENYKKSGKTPSEYEYKPIEGIAYVLDYCIKKFLKMNKDNIFELFEIKQSVERLKTRYMERLSTMSNKQTVILKNLIKRNVDKKKEISGIIKQTMRKQSSSNIAEYDGKSIFDILNIELRYLNPLTFEDMINKWENECKINNCNYLAVEYPEFASPGGYQLAINAKPLFIKKALELCDGRNVLYIDGDMFIKKYPSIFDLTDVDFMARGWWIDPRSSYKMEESITYDPYTFETSGGTMFFSQSPESKMLIETWIKESEKPYQQGKADDRILSLIFNTYKFILNMKIIQLPVEYLWLTLDYDDRMMEMVYDYDYAKMRTSIFIEHPECLTTEDTATGAGASSDRTPKFYDFLDDNLVPTSEEIHEYLMFPNKEMTSAFREYFEYMNGITYLDDGNPLLVERGYINPSDPASNESPLYITSYDDRLGNKKYPGDPDYTINQISEINYKRANSMNIESMRNVNNKSHNSSEYVEINPDPEMNDAKLISLIIRLLTIEKKTVIFNPNTDDSKEYYNKLLQNMVTLYSDMDIVFTPKIGTYYFSDFFKPEIDYTKPILFRPGNRILIDFLSMFLSLDEVSSYLRNGAYQIISRCRIGYLIKPRDVMIGGNGDEISSDKEDPLNDYIDTYNIGLEQAYKIIQQNGGYKKRNHRKKSYKSIKNKRKQLKDKRKTMKKSNNKEKSNNKRNKKTRKNNNKRNKNNHKTRKVNK